MDNPLFLDPTVPIHGHVRLQTVALWWIALPLTVTVTVGTNQNVTLFLLCIIQPSIPGINQGQDRMDNDQPSSSDTDTHCRDNGLCCQLGQDNGRHKNNWNRGNINGSQGTQPLHHVRCWNNNIVWSCRDTECSCGGIETRDMTGLDWTGVYYYNMHLSSDLNR